MTSSKVSARALLLTIFAAILCLSASGQPGLVPARLGIDAFAHVPPSSGNLVVEVFGVSAEPYARAEFPGNLATGPTNQGGGYPAPKIIAALLPDMNYRLRASRSSTYPTTPISDCMVEINFDVPEGHTLLVNGRPMKQLREPVFPNWDGRKEWTLRLVTGGYAKFQAGDHRDPYVSDDYLLDIFMGDDPQNPADSLGWLRLKRSAFLDGTFNKNMLFLQQETAWADLRYDTNGQPRALYAYPYQITFTDLPAEQGTGFSIRFSESYGEGPQLMKEYIIKRGSSNSELIVSGPKGDIVYQYELLAGNIEKWTIVKRAPANFGYTVYDWEKIILERHLSPAGWDFKEVETRMSKHGRNEDGGPTGDFIVDAHQQRFFENFSYSSSIPNEWLGGKRTERLLRRVEVPADASPNPAQLVTSFDYYTSDSSKLGSYGKLRNRVGPDGNWHYLIYNEDETVAARASRGSVKAKYLPLDNYLPASFSDSPPASSITVVETYGYQSWGNSFFKGLLSSTEHRRADVLVGRETIDTTLSDASGSPAGTEDIMTRGFRSYTSASEYLERVEKIYSPYAEPTLQSKPLQTIAADGTCVSYEYSGPGVTVKAYAYTLPNGYENPGVYAVIDTPIYGYSVRARVGRWSGGQVIYDPNISTSTLEHRDLSWNLYYRGESIITDGSGTTTVDVSWTRYIHASGTTQLYRVDYSDGTQESVTQIAWEPGKTGRVGRREIYTKDSFGREFRVVRKGLVDVSVPTIGVLNEPDTQTDTVFDSLNRAIAIYSKSVGGAESLSESTVYYPDGSVKSKTASCCSTTSFQYYYGSGWTSVVSSASVDARRAILTTEPSGNQELRTYRADGSLFEVWRTDPSYSSAAWTKISQAISGIENGRIFTTTTVGSSQWEKTTVDWLGRPVAIQKSAPPQDGLPASATTQYFYEAGTGRLTKTTTSGRAAVFFQNDAVNGISRTIVDANANGQADLGIDRVSETTAIYEFTGGCWWQKKTEAVYISGQVAKVLVTNRTRLSGFGLSSGEATVSESQSTDVKGRTVTKSVKLTPAERKVVTTVVDSLTGQTSTSIEVNGLLRAESLPSPGSGWIRYGYDDLGRSLFVESPLTGTTYTGYVSGSTRVDYTISSGKRKIKNNYYTGSASQGSRHQVQSTETYLYVSGSVADPSSYTQLDATVSITYNAAGMPASQGGSGAHAVSFQYDFLGRKTLQQSSNDSGPVTTEWSYENASGLLEAKRFRENTSVAQTWQYSYDLAGAVRKSIDPRNIPVEYIYSPMGEVAHVEYNSARSGYEVSYTYDRLGRAETITDETMGLRTLSYRDSDDLQIQQVAYAGYYGSAITAQYFEYHEGAADKRLKAVVLKSGTSEVYRSERSYSSVGQIDSVSTVEPNGAFSRSFNFDYTDINNPYAPSTLTTSVAGGLHYRHDYHYDDQGRLDAIAAGRVTGVGQMLINTSGQSSGAGSTYGHYYYIRNVLGQIRHEERRGDLFAGFTGGGYGGVATTYGYDLKGQIDSAASSRLTPGTYGSGYEAASLPGLSIGYAYDGSGNLTRRRLDLDTSAGVDSGAYAETSFVSNKYNQLDSRISSGVLGIGGTADMAALVAVGSNLQNSAGVATRVGPYFHRGVGHDNSQAMLNVTATLVAQITGSPRPTSVETRKAVVPKASMSYAYDASGNMTSDGEYTYTWDNQNRLNSVVRTAQASGWLGAGLGQIYRYSPDGWRVEKEYTQGDLAGKRTRYVYFGADVIAEVDVSVDGGGGVTNSVLTKTYHWRPDGVGRAGRLLEIVDRVRNRAALPGYDGRGNITTWSDASDGAMLGGRDHGPYGERWLETWYDPHAKAAFGEVGFGFSTEYRDETGLVYYGFRYYRPELGRFISRDPAGEAGSGANLYAFAGNDPVNNRELYGLCPFGLGSLFGFIKDVFDDVSSVFKNVFGLNTSNYGDLGETIMLDRFVTTESRLASVSSSPMAFVVTIAVYVPRIDVQDWISRLKDMGATASLKAPPSASTDLERECDELLSQGREALNKSNEYYNRYEQYKSDPNRIGRLEEARSGVMSGGEYAWAAISSGMGAIPLGSIFSSGKYGSIVEDFEFGRQAGVDLLNGTYGSITAANAIDRGASLIGAGSTLADVSARAARTSFGGSGATAFSRVVGRYNPYVALAAGYVSTISASERYARTNIDFKAFERLQQDTLAGFKKQAEVSGRSADNLMKLWKQKGCDKL